MWLGYKGRKFPADLTFDDPNNVRYYYLYRQGSFLFAIFEDSSKNITLDQYSQEEIEKYIDRGFWTVVQPDKWAIDSLEQYQSLMTERN